MKKHKQKIEINKPATNPTIITSYSNNWHQWLVVGVAIVLYANTILHQYTQDDAIVIYENIYTKAGISGWADIFSKDTFAGFFKDESKLNLVSGGRYRPFTLAMFAIEYQLVGNNPWLGHLINVLLFGFLCWAIYKFLALLICKNNPTESKYFFILCVSLIFAAHPIHTEAVANIKGRDEIMAMLCSVISLYYLVQYIDNKKVGFLYFSIFSFFVGLLSKENTITFLAIAPLAIYFFRNFSLKESILKSAILWVPAIIFLIIRTVIVGNSLGTPPLELMNNPFLKYEAGIYVPFSFNEKLATIFYTLGKYLQLLFFPIQLTHDYYPRHIDKMSFGDISVIASLFIYILMAYFAYKSFKTKNVLSFGILFFLITLSIVSNLVFPIGTNMSERFVFMPSLGFAIVMAYFMQKYLYEKFGKVLFVSTLGIVLLLFSYKTFTRNLVWESDFKLFTTDVKTSTQSAKILNAAAGALSVESVKETDPTKKEEMLQEALTYINKALEVHPTYKNAYFIKGNILNYLKDYDNSLVAYQKALDFDPNFVDAKRNYAITLRDAGRKAGEIDNNFPKAERMLSKADSLLPNDTETLRLLGIINGTKGNHQKAISYFEKVVQLEPNNSIALLNLGQAYSNIGNSDLAQKYTQKAKQLNPSLEK
ncbi:MAG: tetratricopeptide repeat protein [Bacteroidota bacterium]